VLGAATGWMSCTPTMENWSRLSSLPISLKKPVLPWLQN